MIHGECKTNLDEFKSVRWPDQFVALPRVGDSVMGVRYGPGPGSHPVLTVVGVTHCMANKDIPCIVVELHR
jgi:hypothetical protein